MFQNWTSTGNVRLQPRGLLQAQPQDDSPRLHLLPEYSGGISCQGSGNHPEGASRIQMAGLLRRLRILAILTSLGFARCFFYEINI